MQKLTNLQLQFIDGYLIKNKVKYWDVRMELIDHIASLIEGKIEQGETFENAMFLVHEGFGNNLNKPRLNKDNTAWITTTSIYESNEGFEKLILEKTSMLRKKYSRLLWREIRHLFIDLKFIMLMLVFVVLACVFYTDLTGKQLWLCNVLLLLVPLCFMVPRIFKKQIKKSLAVTTAFGLYLPLSLGISNLSQVLGVYDFTFNKQICLSSFFILLPLMISFCIVFKKVIKEQNDYYKFSIQ